jgi:hypothetical protein
MTSIADAPSNVAPLRRIHRRLSVDLEEAWLVVAGFLLRPGFGVDGKEESRCSKKDDEEIYREEVGQEDYG